MSSDPFFYVSSINGKDKTDVLENEKDYTPFIVNRALSYFTDTILIANEMNLNYSIDNRLQYQFLLHAVSPKKRFSKWAKVAKQEEIDLIRECYQVNNRRAKEMLLIMQLSKDSPSPLEVLRERLSKGGKK